MGASWQTCPRGTGGRVPPRSANLAHTAYSSIHSCFSPPKPIVKSAAHSHTLNMPFSSHWEKPVKWYPSKRQEQMHILEAVMPTGVSGVGCRRHRPARDSPMAEAVVPLPSVDNQQRINWTPIMVVGERPTRRQRGWATPVWGKTRPSRHCAGGSHGIVPGREVI